MEMKFYDNNSNELILFFMGWGCDNNQFDYLKSSRDVIMVWDYSSLDFNFDPIKKYNKIYLIAYSAGVYITNLIQDKLPKCDLKVAINGIPYLFDKNGLSPAIVNMMANLDLMNFEDFLKEYLVYDEKDYKIFMSHSAQRDFESSSNELSKLLSYKQIPTKTIEYDKAILSDSDKIFKLENQKELYKGKSVIVEKTAHHIFSKFNSFDEILELVGVKSLICT